MYESSGYSISWDILSISKLLQKKLGCMSHLSLFYSKLSGLFWLVWALCISMFGPAYQVVVVVFKQKAWLYLFVIAWILLSNLGNAGSFKSKKMVYLSIYVGI